ncbi:MAG: BON domain-containing protein [Thermoanaerobaculia bacterium]
MNTSSIKSVAIWIALLSSILILSPGPLRAASPTGEIIASGLARAGVAVGQLSVVRMDGVVIVRGRVPDAETLRRADSVLKSLGIRRVANMIRVVPPIDDAALERTVERALYLSRSLAGCQFRVDSRNGWISVTGNVRYDMQREVARNIVRRVDGVRGATFDLTM